MTVPQARSTAFIELTSWPATGEEKHELRAAIRSNLPSDNTGTLLELRDSDRYPESEGVLFPFYFQCIVVGNEATDPALAVRFLV